MELTNPEKLILVMLAEIQKKLGLTDTDPEFIQSVIFSENTWALSSKFTSIVGSSPSEEPPEVHEVGEILDMWWLIERAHSALSAEEKNALATGAAPFGNDVRFRGFDGNNESEQLNIARCFVEDLGRFQDFKGRELNSHFPSVDGYRRMLKAFDPIRRGLGHRGMTRQEIETVLLARRFPE